MKILIIASALMFSSIAFSKVKNFSPDRLLVKLKKNQKMPTSTNITNSRKLFGNIYVVYTKNLQKLESELTQSNKVEYIEKDYIAPKRKLAEEVKTVELPFAKSTHAAPFNDPGVSRIWAFKNSEKNGISVSRAYLNRSSSPQKEIIVAVVDTGVDYNHEDLKDVMWVNKNEIPNNGIDDDGNGYIDDIHGINTLQRDNNGNATGNMMDTHSHGTHVSGTIGATQNNNIGVAGIASNVKIMGIRTVPNRGDETDVDIVESFIYAAKNGAKIINCSFGKANNEGGMVVSEAIDYIGDKYGVLVIAASGNSSRNIDSRLTYPASFENETLLVVASTTKWGGMSSFSNYGIKNVDVAAPGSGVYSTTLRNRYASMSGTSMASPTTAGAAAEVLAHYPNLTPRQLKKILMESVTKVGRFEKKLASGGRIDLQKALTMAQSF